MITIQLLQAGVGDTILVSVIPERKDKPVTCLLIDSGYHFNSNTLPILKELPAASKIDRLIITHYDSDHIAGAKSFIKKNEHFSSPKIILIDQVWLNTFRHLQEEKRPAATLEDIKKLEALITDLPEPPESDSEYEISASQASQLGAELIRYGYPWNTDFNEKAVCIEQGPVVMINDVKLTLLSPNKNALKKLETEFIDVLRAKQIPISDSELIDDAFELYQQQEAANTEHEISGTPEINAAYIRKCCDGADYDPDDAAGNGSSIAFMLEAEERRFLFLADAHAEPIIAALKTSFPDEKNYPIFFDAVKVAHHGSFRNNHPDLFKLIDSPEWLISTNGEHPSHQHPDIQTIACIINRPVSRKIPKRLLSFNYPLDHIAELENEALKTEFNYDLQVKINSEWK